MASDTTLERILNAFGDDPERPPEKPISKSDVSSWMTDDDLETMGALSCLLTDERHYKRITPPLNFEDYHPFMLRYFEKCLLENADSEWASSRYEAGHETANWFKGLWNEEGVPRTALEDLKAMLGKLYRQGDDALRRCIVDATLEHLFEAPEIAHFFSDWKSDEDLGEAYRAAAEWVEKGGSALPHG